ncbi:hypothetical protein K1X45_14685 [Pseudochrobactrum sp. Wa41.01b-1]|uniref:hypothetical protein n=1 Tax=Pseudochrobactrum sp. Wa41.01b-1 TaxID=2864102 RepID=UPI001C68C172|nr:hypothetical protein [Pseudochrobactrum sp. Wa41.01b-1]QYM72677.1 hypothetical protein K1X45_14685 [Pseudochrobactrum sp. Wa41.01b-1]
MNSIEVRDRIIEAYRNRSGIDRLKKNIVSLVALTVRGSPDLKRTLEQMQRDNFNQAATGFCNK